METDAPTRRRHPFRRLLLPGALGVLAVLAACAQNPGAPRGPYPGFAEYEGEPVAAVSFTGNLVLPLDSLRALTTIQPPQCRARFLPSKLCFLGFKRYYLDLSDLAGDVVRLQLYHRDHGYYGSRVVPDVEPVDSEHVSVDFAITPGDKVTLNKLTVEGTEGIVPEEEVKKILPLKEGEPFRRVGFLNAADSLRQVLYARGYAYANVLRNYAIDTIADVAQADYVAVPGPVVTVDSILVVGAERLDRHTVVKQLNVRKGQILQLPQLTESQKNLYQLAIVNFATVELASDSLQVDPDSSTATVAVRVVESAKYQANTGLGFGTVDCVRTSARLLDRNFMGGGRTMELSATAAKIGAGAPLDFGFRSSRFCGGSATQVPDTVLTYRLAADFLQPRLLGTRTRLGVNVHAERQSEIALYLRRSVGSQITVSRGIGRGALLGAGLNVERGSTTASRAIFCVIFAACTDDEQRPLETSRWSNAASLSASLDRTRGPTEAVNGYLLRSALAWASPVLLSDDRYLSIFGDANLYRVLRPGWQLAGRIQGGVFVTGVAGATSGYIPPERRFYAGGPNSVRGFPPNALGPQAYVTQDNRPDFENASVQRYPLGGTRMLVASAELRTPSPFLPQYLRWAAFVDAGQLWATGTRNPDTDVDFGRAPIYVTPGLGVRISTPVGPIRMDVGYNPYGLRPGPLYLTTLDDRGHATGELQLLDPNFQPRRSGLLSRLEVQVAVGQAF
jgi:outer membrane protein assembly complex protein YaeT